MIGGCEVKEKLARVADRTKVLIVDDRRENIISLEHLIRSAEPELDIRTALSGPEALALLIEHDFALCLLDVQMPDMSGIELATIMRSSERCSRIPIIFVTAGRYEEKTIFEGYELGAVDFLYKPLAAPIVRSKVRVFVELDQQRRRLHAQVTEMQSLKLAAEAANAAKSQFLANMSHEMRTPLTAVLGYGELIELEQAVAAEQRPYVGAILHNGRLLLRLVDDILDLARIESGRLQLERVPISIGDILNDLYQSFRPKAEERGLRLSFELPANVPPAIHSDPLRLRQILANLLSNALKFTRTGEVSLTLRIEGWPRSLSFHVRDSGCGLSAEQLQHIFQPFVQADNSTTRLYGGSGLGLPIARQLAQALGGDVRCLWTAPGQGSIFVATVDSGMQQKSGLPPLDRTSSPRDEVPMPAKQLQGLRVLVVDDSAENRLLVTRFLTMEGAIVNQAENGEEGVHKALELDADLILMDIQMPFLDGYEATRRLRELGFEKPIIALSAHALREEKERSLLMGCNEHLTKPINRLQLVSSVYHFGRQRGELKSLS